MLFPVLGFVVNTLADLVKEKNPKAPKLFSNSFYQLKLSLDLYLHYHSAHKTAYVRPEREKTLLGLRDFFSMQPIYFFFFKYILVFFCCHIKTI